MDVLKRNNVSVKGTGSQAMLFVHGFGCDQSMWRFVTPAFEADYQIILMDLVGAGKSDLSAYVPEKYNNLGGYADDIIEICEALSLNDFILVGHSVSSMIGALVDIKRSGLISKLIMIGPSPCYINKENYTGGFKKEDIEDLLEVMESNFLGWSASLAPSIMGNPDRPKLGEELTNSFCQTDPTIAKQFARVTFLSDNRSDVEKIKAPSLILQCSEDIIAPTTVGQYMADHIQNSRLQILNATGHCPHMSAPDEVIVAMKSFLSN